MLEVKCYEISGIGEWETVNVGGSHPLERKYKLCFPGFVGYRMICDGPVSILTATTYCGAIPSLKHPKAYLIATRHHV